MNYQLRIFFLCATLHYPGSADFENHIESIRNDTLIDSSSIRVISYEQSTHQKLSVATGTSFFKQSSGGNALLASYALYGQALPLGAELLFCKFSTGIKNYSSTYIDTSRSPIDTFSGYFSQFTGLYFLGSFLSARIAPRNTQFVFYPDIGIGFLFFFSQSIQRFSLNEYRALMPCVSFGLSIDYMLSSIFSIETGARFYSAHTTKVAYNEFEADLISPLNLDRLDFYLGFSLHFTGNQRVNY